MWIKLLAVSVQVILMTEAVTEKEIEEAEREFTRREELKEIVEEDKELLKKLE